MSKSAAVATLLGVQPSIGDYNALHALLFYVLTNFVAGHEWAHHVHGHACLPDADPIFPSEILDSGCDGSIEGQIKEIDADGYSIYHVLTNLFDNQGRTWLSVLALETEPLDVQDKALFSLVLLAIGAYLFVRCPPELNPIDVYVLTHPPQAARMDFLRQEAMNWCRRDRPQLRAWMTPTRFEQLMNAATEATLGVSAARVWGHQSAFLQSETGAKYFEALAEGTNAYKRSL